MRWVPGRTLSFILALIVVGAATSFKVYSERYSSERIISECLQSATNFKALCYTTHINEVLSDKGLRPALELVALSYAADPYVATFCHSNMHDLGAAAYKEFVRNDGIDLTSDGSYCGFGFYHGFMEEMFAETGSLDQARTFCSYVGKRLGGEQAYAEGSCYHGIGHGVTDGTDVSRRGDARALAAPGLALCRKVTDKEELGMRCASGVFNSVALMYRDPSYTLDAKNDPYAMCRFEGYSEREKKACYDQMNTLVSYLSKRDPEKALSYAMRVADPAYRLIAIKAAMGLVFVPPSTTSVERAPDICATASVRDQEACVRGLVDGLIEFGAPGKESNAALSFCAMSQWSVEQGRTCMDELVTYAQGLYSADEQRRLCERMPTALLPVRCATLGAGASSSDTDL